MTTQEQIETLKQQKLELPDERYIDSLSAAIESLNRQQLIILQSLHHKYCKYMKGHECTKDCSYIEKHTDYLEDLKRLDRFEDTKGAQTPWEQNFQTAKSLERLLGDGGSS